MGDETENASVRLGGDDSEIEVQCAIVPDRRRVAIGRFLVTDENPHVTLGRNPGRCDDRRKAQQYG